MGYMFPGIFILVVFLYVFDDSFEIHDIFQFDKFVDVAKLHGDGFDLDKSIMIIILGYVTGHFVSYASSITIENASNSVFGYPSKYLLYGNNKTWADMMKGYFKIEVNSSFLIFKYIKTIFKFILKLLLFALMLPIMISIFTIGWLVDLNSYISRPLDDYLKDAILNKQDDLFEMLKIHKPKNINCDVHRMIMHYVYINIPNCQRKVDNYISLYGFLRAMTFVFCICFDLCLVYSVFSINLSSSLDWDIISELALLYLMTCLSYLSFMKFYRRCTLENYMALLAGSKDFIKENADSDEKKQVIQECNE